MHKMNKNTKTAMASKVEEVAKETVHINALSLIKTEQDNAQDATFEEIKEPKPRTILEIMRLVQNKQLVMAKLEKLNQTEKNLDSFNLGTDGLKDHLQIKDAEGTVFQTSNSQIIETVIATLKAEIAIKRELAEIELAEGL